MYDAFWKLCSLVVKADCAGKDKAVKFAEDRVVESETLQ